MQLMAHWYKKKNRKKKTLLKKKRFLEREQMPLHPLDIFHKKFTVPSSVIIVAPGKGGELGYSFIKPEHYTICVNRGVRAPIDHANVWMVADGNAPNAFWFPDPVPDETIVMLDDGKLRKLADRDPDFPHKYDYVFRTGWRVENYDYKPRQGILRGGCTIACQAIQMAYMCGAKEIILCGVGMIGPYYWDNIDSEAYGMRKKVWGIVPKVDKVIKWMMNNGANIWSMTPTALNVKQPVRCYDG